MASQGGPEENFGSALGELWEALLLKKLSINCPLRPSSHSIARLLQSGFDCLDNLVLIPFASISQTVVRKTRFANNICGRPTTTSKQSQAFDELVGYSLPLIAGFVLLATTLGVAGVACPDSVAL